MDKKAKSKKGKKSRKDPEFSIKDAISFAKSVQTDKIKFTKKEKKQIISNLIDSYKKRIYYIIMKSNKYPKYGNKASKAVAKEVQKANSSSSAKKEIKRLKKAMLKISKEASMIIDLKL